MRQSFIGHGELDVGVIKSDIFPSNELEEGFRCNITTSRMKRM